MDREAEKVLEGFHPAVRDWFARRFQAPTEPQMHGWPVIGEGSNTLITAPTGSGKTLAAFLSAIDQLLHADPAGCRVVYVSPLKALVVDVEAEAESEGLLDLEDRVGALDGRLTVERAPGGGVRIRAEIPCG